jgi:hypothetical protein
MLELRRRAGPPRRLLGIMLLAVLAAVLLQGAGVSHTHAGVGPGLYNQEHDLALLAVQHGNAVLHESQPAPLVFAVVTTVTPLGARSPASAPRPTADSRAPPLA